MDDLGFLKEIMDRVSAEKIAALGNSSLVSFVKEYVKICEPSSVFVRTDSSNDIDYIRNKALELKEEIPLATKGHTVHFDGIYDQARDKKNTKYLIYQKDDIGHYMNGIDKSSGLKDIRNILSGIMRGKEMFICFFCLGPVDSPFSLSAVQITDSPYVAHSEDILYRPGYASFQKEKPNEFFKFVHSEGELTNNVSRNISKRRIYVDLGGDTVYSVNTQYAGNTIGLKKPALRLAINKASSQGWLSEHMFLMAVFSKDGRKTYFCGAYPSMCGKTSTALVAGEAIVGDDITYIKNIEGEARAVNVERGIFGIIKDVNPHDDPSLFKALVREGELIFSNILIDSKKMPYWLGKDSELPQKGINFSGKWFPGKTNEEGKEILPSHKNARYAIRLSNLDCVDENLENPKGVDIKGIIYGGRDSDTWFPVEESFNWRHGVVTKGAGLESETTAATLGEEGIRLFNPFSNMDFLSIPLGKYIRMHLDFGERLKTPPRIFSVNYFLKDKQGKFLNDIVDKRIWLKWMELRVNGQTGALRTPTGFIPEYQDLKDLFGDVLNKDYAEHTYIEQFTLRVSKNMSKIKRIENIYKDIDNIPSVLFEELKAQHERLSNFYSKFGDYISPFIFERER